MNELYRLNDIDRNLNIAKFRPLDILIVGATGAGKSSTINALFEKSVTRVGQHCDPETMSISAMQLNDFMRFWDTPGLGDDVKKDKGYSKDLIDLLYRDYYMDDNRYGLIDNVLVILDGSGRDMGTTYRLLNDVIIPNFNTNRILVAINQADMAMKGRHWNEITNCPDEILLNFLEQKANSICTRLLEATGVNIQKPVFYSAGKITI